MFFDCTQEGCDKVFNCKKALKEHERTHNQDRPFKCELCDQTFTQYSSLQKHARVHDKKKPFKCNNNGCNQAFSQVSNLIRHQRIHTGEKPYECEICGKQFASGSNLKQHVQIHDRQVKLPIFNLSGGEKPVQICDKNYLYPSSLKKHYTVSHKEEYEKYLADQQSKFQKLSKESAIVETCGFHLRDQEPFSNNLKLNNPREQNLESYQENLIESNKNEGLETNLQATRQYKPYQKGSQLQSLNFSSQDDQISAHQKMSNTLLPAKRSQNFTNFDDKIEDQGSNLEGTVQKRQKINQNSDLINSQKNILAQQPSLMNPSSGSMNENALNAKLSEDLKNSLYLTCHMYFINNPNGAVTDPQLQQQMQAYQSQNQQLIDKAKDKLKDISDIEGNQRYDTQKSGQNLLGDSQIKQEALNNINNDFNLQQNKGNENNQFQQFDHSQRHQNKQYQNTLVQQMQSILEQQNQAFNKNMENQSINPDFFNNYQQQQVQPNSVQASLPLQFPRLMQHHSNALQMNSPALSIPGISQNHFSAVNSNPNTKHERASNNSHSILSPSVCIKKNQIMQNNHGSNFSNHSVFKSSHFKYKAQRLNEIRKPTPLREGSLNFQNSAVANQDENKAHIANQNEQQQPIGTSQFSKRNSQFYPQNDFGSKANEIDLNEVEYEENEEEEEEDVLAYKKVPIEQSLFQATITQELEDINKQRQNIHSSLSAQPIQKAQYPSAFQQVKRFSHNSNSNGNSNLGSNNLANNMVIKRSSSESSICGEQSVVNTVPENPKKSFFFNGSGFNSYPVQESKKVLQSSVDIENQDENINKSALSGKNLENISQNLATLRNVNLQNQRPQNQNEDPSSQQNQ